MFVLTRDEYKNLRSQFAILEIGVSRYNPMVFTEQDEKILLIFEYIRQLEQVREEESRFRERRKIGFKTEE